jgi:hypothetical protein
MRERELRALAAQMAERYGLDPEVFVPSDPAGEQLQSCWLATAGRGRQASGRLWRPRPKIRGSASLLCGTAWIRWRTCDSVRSIWLLCSANTTATTGWRSRRITQGRDAWTVLVESRALKRRRTTWRRSWVGSYGLSQGPTVLVNRPRAPNLGPGLSVPLPSSGMLQCGRL